MASPRLLGALLMTCVVVLPTGGAAVGRCPARCACQHNLTVVDCSRAGFSVVPALPAAAQAVILDNNPLMTLSSDAFCNVTGARQVSLQNCQLRSVGELAFRRMSRLTSLVLAKNELDRLPGALLAGNTGLENLVLSDNRLTLSALAPVVSGLGNLRMLDIGNNAFEGDASLPAEFAGLVRLRTLKLNGVVMDELPANYFRPLENSSLVELVISGRLANVSRYALADVTSLTTLDVSDTAMTSLDAANLLRGLENATDLTALGMNSVFGRARRANSTVHKHFFQPLAAASLRVIRFRGNPRAFNGVLQHRMFKSLHGLLELYLDSCALHAVHAEALHGLGRLRVLGLSGNLLTCHEKPACGFLLAKGHDFLSSLEVFDLSYNNIVAAPDLAFHGKVFPKLQTLFLAHNRLRHLSEATFRGLDKLKHLDLAGNPIGAIDPDAFLDLSQLTGLLLNGTKVLESLPARAFQGCKKLRVLDLADGDLSAIDPDAFRGLKKLQYLNLRNNFLGSADALENVSVDAPSLWKLDLGYNRLTSLPAFVSRLADLKELFLDNNYLQDDCLGQLADNANLEVVDLSFNSILRVSDAFAGDHRRLRKISIQNNPFLCDCSAPDVGGAFARSNVTVVNASDHRCSAPEGVRGQSIFAFRPSPWQCRVKVAVVPVVCVLATLLVCALVVLVRRIGCDRARIQIKDFCNWDNCYFRLSSNLEATDLGDQDSRL